ncbi:hypothetical protein N7491_011112 [Penicillium cf. griseofulvum]|uniref:G domain-containing protein n=1 Tax=Penicillium cf. griseofulvum TaxID=2972120 RepID=A0A9W9T6G8_9EURO|nr:hypothetical protein N7472_001431 [Penicillium cf. griseofulvum]KAJ5422667.1 hypothetical protein N7491_011112 [Penicillium cf. griseofulvum]
MSVTGRRSSRQSQPSRDPRPNDICIAILGATGSGKSSFISKYSGKPVKISHNLNACTSTIDVYAYDLSPSRTVYLIDTPGFDDIKSDSEVLEELKTWLENSYRKHIRLNGIIYLHRITDIRMQASAKRNLMIFHELCGQDFLKKVILVTTMWDQISTTKGVKRENYLINEPAFWGFMLKKGSSLHRHDNTRNSAMEIVHRLAKIDMPATTELQAMEARKIKLSEDHPDTPTNIANQTSTNRNQGQLGEVELEVQMIEISKPIFGLERFEALNPSSGPVTHNKHVEFEDSDSSSSIENASVFSLPMSIPSTSSLDSGKEEINSLLIRQFANLLCEDGVLVSILSVGISNETIGYERMRNNFRRLLKHFANDLKTDIFSASHQDLRSFVNSYSTMITRELFAMTTTDKEGILKLHILDTDVASDETRLSHEMKVEFYLQNLRRGDIANPDEESDQDSVTEEAGEDEPYEGSLQNLDQMKHFILESAAYQIFRRRLEEFVQPSLYSREKRKYDYGGSVYVVKSDGQKCQTPLPNVFTP